MRMHLKRKKSSNVSDEDTAFSSFSSLADSDDQPTLFERGDHVYQWCSVGGVPRVYQHHGIVMHIELIPSETEGGEAKQRLTIADFSNYLPSSESESEQPPPKQPADSEPNKVDDEEENISTQSMRKFTTATAASLIGAGESTGGILRVYTTWTTSQATNPWYKVEYGASRWKMLFDRSGVSTSMKATDPPEVVLSRVNFLLRHRTQREANDTFRSAVLPQYHLLFANCECVAMWAKTGKFSTLQGASLLKGATTWAYSGGTIAMSRAAVAQEGVALGLVGSGVTSGGATSTAVAASSAQPLVMGALTAYGVVTMGTLLVARSRWKATTKRLNEAYEEETGITSQSMASA